MLGRGVRMVDETGQREAARRVLSSARLSRAPRSLQLLRHLVDETLAGRADQLDGTRVAQDVFGRGSEFDASTDSIVRVQMGRLRQLLADYYAEEGRDDPVALSIPSGRYVPVFTARPEAASGTETDAPPKAKETKSRRRRLAAVGAFAAAAFAVWAAVWMWYGPDGVMNEGPLVLVPPFENATGDPAYDALRRSVQTRIVTTLKRFRAVRAQAVEELAEAPRANYVIRGTLVSGDDGLSIIASTQEIGSGTHVVVGQMSLEDANDSYFQAITRFAERVGGRLAGSYGHIARQRARAPTAIDGTPRLFDCLVLFAQFSDAKTANAYAAAHACMSELESAGPPNSTVLSTLAWLDLVALSETGVLPPGEAALGGPDHQAIVDEASLADALTRARRAVRLDPSDASASIYLGLIEWFAGRDASALLAFRTAHALNPADADAVADLGLFLTLAGNREEGLRMAAHALELEPRGPRWYRQAFLHDAIVRGDAPAARNALDAGAARGDPFEFLYEAVVAVMLNDDETALMRLPRLRATALRHDGDPLGGLRRWLRPAQHEALLSRICTIEAELCEALQDGPSPDERVSLNDRVSLRDRALRDARPSAGGEARS